MLRKPAVNRNPGKRRVSTTRSVPAPVLGWNARDSIANMKEAYAVRLENWFPTASDVMLRKGSAAHVTGITGEVETLATYKPESGSEKLFAFANDAIYDVSTAGSVGSAAVSSLTSNRWQTTNFATTGGNFLLCVNGADDMRTYDGSSWASVTGASSPAITNVSTDDLVNLGVFKERVFYIEANSLSAWYTAVGAFSGALTELPLQAVFKEGGSLVAMGSWSLDGGTGMDDYAVFITTEGECAVYQGTNPASSSTWALVGVFKVGKPIGRRCMQKLGGDLLIITTDGVVPASKAFVRARSDDSIAITDVIQGAMAESVAAYGAEFGWQLTLYPEATMLVLNVPNTLGQQQFVMNTYTKAWCLFTGWEANCFAEFNGGLYFGGSEIVDRAWTTGADHGVGIRGDMVQAFNYFGDRANLKYMTMMRPTMSWDFPPDTMRIGVNMDFDISDPQSEITLVASSGSVWDTGKWDSAKWGGQASIKNLWYSATGVGYAAALHIIASSSEAERLSVAATNYVFERGSTL